MSPRHRSARAFSLHRNHMTPNSIAVAGADRETAIPPPAAHHHDLLCRDGEDYNVAYHLAQV
jgi:hypothetical protein